MNDMSWSRVAAMALGLAVMLGAFGAHAMKDRLDAYSMGVYEKAVFYHFIHALGMLIVSILPRLGVLTALAGWWVCSLLCAGIVLFSGSLYVLAVTGLRGLGAVTPFGGVAFLAACLLLPVCFFRGK